MLSAMGVPSFEELIAGIPTELRLSGELPLPEAESEFEMLSRLSELAGRNQTAPATISFLGAGGYDHFSPAAVSQLASRSEFATSYTPYQAEVSQGTLQAIYEFQSAICEITAMDVVNASLYDGASAVAEACLMANRINQKPVVLVSEGLYEPYVAVIETYLQNTALSIERIPTQKGLTNLDWLNGRLNGEVSAVVVQSPNRYGLIEAWKETGRLCADHSSLFIAVGDPLAFGIFAPPGECGADIYAGEGQTLGLPLSAGGPYLGLFACRKEYVRKMPGRLVGAAKDVDGKSGFVLALQTREQHIRREKATSNICTNQGLMALSALIHLALLGREGYKSVAQLCFQKAHYLASKVDALEGFSLPMGMKFFREFVVRCPVPAETIISRGAKRGILPGTPLAEDEFFLRVAVTEKRSKPEMDRLVGFLGEFRP